MGIIYSKEDKPLMENPEKKNLDYYTGDRFFKIPNLYYRDKLGVRYFGQPHNYDSYLFI
jgi:hypothetical protein